MWLTAALCSAVAYLLVSVRALSNDLHLLRHDVDRDQRLLRALPPPQPGTGAPSNTNLFLHAPFALPGRPVGYVHHEQLAGSTVGRVVHADSDYTLTDLTDT